MARSMSVFSNKAINPKSVHELMTKLQAVRDDNGWLLSRNDRSVFIQYAQYEIEDLSNESAKGLLQLLGAPPRTCLAMVFAETGPDRFEFRMARAVAKAMSEEWPIVLDDKTGNLELITPRAIAGTDR